MKELNSYKYRFLSVLLLLCAFSLGLKAENYILPLDEKFTAALQDLYEISPTEDGVLTITFENGVSFTNSNYFVYKLSKVRGSWIRGERLIVDSCNGTLNSSGAYTGVTEASWNLYGGESYCVMSALGSVTMTAHFDNGELQKEEHEIFLNQKTPINLGEVFKFECPASGVLNVVTDNNSSALASLPESQYFFYKNEECTDLLTLAYLSWIGQGWRVKFEVSPGTYYIKHAEDAIINFTLSLDENEEVLTKLVEVQPKPGIATDMYMGESTVSVLFSPADVQIDNVDFVYIDKNREIKTIKNIGYYFGTGSLQFSGPSTMDLKGQPIKESGADVVANYMAAGDGAYMQYVLHNVTRNGVPVTESDLTEGVEFSNGDLIITFYIEASPTLVSATLPSTFYYSWEYGNPSGIAVLNYDQNLDTEIEAEVNIMEGEQNYGVEPDENMMSWSVKNERIKIENNKVIIDFTGDDWYVEEETPWGPTTGVITLYVGNIKALNGLNAKYDGYPAYMPHLEYVAEASPDDKVYDTDVDEIEMAVEPAHSESDSEALSAQAYKAADMKTVTLNWGERELEATGEGGLTVSGPNGYFADFTSETHNFNIEGNNLVIDLSTVIAEIKSTFDNDGLSANAYNGVYCLTLKKGTVRMDGNVTNARAVNPEDAVYNDEKNLYYNIDFSDKVTGVTAIEADGNGMYIVYSLQGITVMKTTDAMDLNSLPEGLYIVNGKKILILN